MQVINPEFTGLNKQELLLLLTKTFDELGDWRATFPNRTASDVIALIQQQNSEREKHQQALKEAKVALESCKLKRAGYMGLDGVLWFDSTKVEKALTTISSVLEKV
jgi:hypothetical protein